MEVGDRAGEGKAYGNLGNTNQSLGDFAKAIEYHTQCLAITKEVGNLAGEGKAYASLGCVCDSVYQLQGALQRPSSTTQHLAIAKEVGDRVGGGRVVREPQQRLSLAGGYAKAIEYHAQHLATQ